MKMTVTPPSFDDRDGLIWYNGELVDWRDAKVHVLNHGLHYGSSVFEGARIYNGKTFHLTRHNERLHASAELLGFKIPYTVAELDAATIELIEKNSIVNGYLRPVAFRGSEQMAIRTDRSTTNVAICAWEMPAYFGEEALMKGLNLTYAKWKRPSPETEPVHAKAAGLYMICTLSKNLAMDNGFDDALMLDYRGYLAEATGANLFLVIDGELHTPTADCFLNGITRQTVMELAKKRGIKVVERHIMPEELANVQQAFLTGSAAEVTPIGSVKGELGDFEFEVGDITRQMMQDYHELVRA
jgi:branched-chain amino acid aminotransferase